MRMICEFIIQVYSTVVVMYEVLTTALLQERER